MVCACAMDIRFTRGARLDTVAVTRADGTAASFTFPHKGPTPHDAFHLFVERELGLARGFWGLVGAGMDPAEVGAMAAAGGHASASRARDPDPAIVELVQAERLVECFEAESWSGAADDAGIRHMARAGWAASKVPELPLPDDALHAIRSGIAAFARDWAGTPVGGEMVLVWPD